MYSSPEGSTVGASFDYCCNTKYLYNNTLVWKQFLPHELRNLLEQCVCMCESVRCVICKACPGTQFDILVDPGCANQ